MGKFGRNRAPQGLKRRRRDQVNVEHLDKKQKKHLKEFGEIHPAEEKYELNLISINLQLGAISSVIGS